jgi:multiple sugar transport system permease protein
LVLADAWKTAPFAALLFLAGLATVPEDLHRQAQVDGAHVLQGFFRITWPLLKPVAAVVVLFRVIDALRVFDLNYVLTGGGPGGATTSLSLLGYRYYLAGDFGLGAAASTVLFLIALGFTWIYVGRRQGVLSP